MRSTFLGLIPARGGSKGIPRKNLRELAGKPLIAWSIEAALKSCEIDRVVVSTDDEEIAEAARKYGAEVPFMRPSELAQDDTPGICVQFHALEWLRDRQGYMPDYSLLLQPTSPLRIHEDIDNIIVMTREKRAEAALSLIIAEQNPFWMKKIDSDGHVSPFLDESHYHMAQRQDLPKVYIPNGALFVANAALLLKHRSVLPLETYGYIMPAERSIDINSEWEFAIAEMLLKRRLLGQPSHEKPI